MKPTKESFHYDVFLSFRGKDTRNTFTSHLYEALSRHNFHIFHDTILSRGLVIGPQLLEAIEESRIFVVVFSTNYADSKWCLDELSQMMHCVKMNTNQILLPVFLDVKKSDVCDQQGSYGEPFSNHETKFDQKRVRKWREALMEAGEWNGLHLQDDANGDEAEFLDQIVEKIRKFFHEQDQQHVAEDLYPFVGIKSRIQELISLLNGCNDNNNDVCIIAICGPTGIGKTTIAKATYDHLSIHFKPHFTCFLPNVKTVYKQSSLNGKITLQKKLISNLIQDDENRININSYHHGIVRIERIIKNQKVLLVLDDVDNDEQLKVLLGLKKRALFGNGSRIIVTTRDEECVVGWVKPDVIYEPKLLDEYESLKVFCLNAFGQDYPKEGYEEVSKEAVSWAAGRGGVLKDLAARLRCFQSVQQWQWGLKDFIRNSE